MLYRTLKGGKRMETKFSSEAKDALSRLIYLGYPRNRARRAVIKALKSIPEDTALNFEKIFRAAMIALR